MTHLDYLLTLPTIQQFMLEIPHSKIEPLFRTHEAAFLAAPAAEKHHHNFSGGLLIHTVEVLIHATAHSGIVWDWLIEHDEFTESELFTAVFLHDFAKIQQYEPLANHAWRWKKMDFQQEIWTLQECMKLGISLTENELAGLLHAEGGFSKFQLEWRPMSVILHAADLWSSQVMKHVWDPAEALKVVCPNCGGNMKSREGSRGPFFGCAKYPACKGIVDGGTVDVDEVFLAWLKKKYPSPNQLPAKNRTAQELWDKVVGDKKDAPMEPLDEAFWLGKAEQEHAK